MGYAVGFSYSTAVVLMIVVIGGVDEALHFKMLAPTHTTHPTQ